MKCTKKLASLLLALVMALSLVTTAFAAGDGSITIDNAVNGQTYTIYEILKLESYNKDAGAYSYKATDAWKDFINGTGVKDVYVNVDAQGYVTWVENADAAAFAKLAQKYAADNNIQSQGNQTANSGKVEFTGLDLGYYLVDSTLGTICSLDTTNPSVTIKEKNAEPTNEKQVEEDSNNTYGKANDADIGQTVNFKSTITAQAGAENYVFEDTMSAGLTYNKDAKVYTDETMTTELAAAYYTVNNNPGNGKTFTITFDQNYLNTITGATKLYVKYSAVVNDAAVVGGNGNPNESVLKYGDANNTKTTPVSKTTTYTWKLDVFKYTTKDGTQTPLADAKFNLSKNADGSDPIKLVSEGNNVYRVATKDDKDTITEITTDATGKFTIEGLDSDTYYLTETAAPAGYNVLKSAITVVISDKGEVSYTYD